jgi:hypothetical protein
MDNMLRMGNNRSQKRTHIFSQPVDPPLTSKQDGSSQDALNEFAAHAFVQPFDTLFPHDSKNAINR